MKLDEIDKAILNRIQSDFPVHSHPFRLIADELGLTESEVVARTRRLKSAGIIRRIGGNFAPHKVGFVSTLCAARVPAERIDHFAAVVNRYSGVTHNYLRDHAAFNVWFTFIARSMEEIENHLDRIRSETHVDTILNLPATRVFKIKAQFDV
jgi:siroheme decarboxylase